MKALSAIFWSACAGIVICLGGTIYTAVQQKKNDVPVNPSSIPTPAGLPATTPAGH